MYFKSSRGSIFVVIVILGVFFLFAMGVLFHSSGERKHVKAMKEHQTAEAVAMSGIDWAEGQLLKGRWYGKKFKAEVSKGNTTYGMQHLNFPNDGGDVTVVCQDVANRVPLWDIDGDYRLYGGLKESVNDFNIKNMGMKELWLLHHIDVYALGNYNDKKCLIYGRFIMSPEPALNSDSTDGIKYGNSKMNPYTNTVTAPFKTSTGYDVKNYKISKIIYKNKTVNPNSIICELIADNGETVKISPPGVGKVVSVQSEKVCEPGDIICVINKQPEVRPGKQALTKTLKKMVRITKVDLSLFPDFDIHQLSDRGAVSSYIEQVSDAYLVNYVAHYALQKKIDKLSISSVPNKMNINKLIQTFPPDVTSMTRDRARNTFLSTYISNFVAPGCKLENKALVKKRAYLQLDHKKTTPPSKLVADLRSLGRLDALNSKPRLNDRYLSPKIAGNEYLRLLATSYNKTTSEFAEDLTGLDDAARNIVVTRHYDENKVETDVSVNITKIRKKYSYVDPINGYTIGMDDLIAFADKYYSTKNSEFPKEEKRNLDHFDWPAPVINSGTGTPLGNNGQVQNADSNRPPGPPNWPSSVSKKNRIAIPDDEIKDFAPKNTPNGYRTIKIAANPSSGRKSNSGAAPSDPGEPSEKLNGSQKPRSFGDNSSDKSEPGTPNGKPSAGDWDYGDSIRGQGDGEAPDADPNKLADDNEKAWRGEGNGDGEAPGADPKKAADDKAKAWRGEGHGDGEWEEIPPGSAAPLPPDSGKIKNDTGWADGQAPVKGVDTLGTDGGVIKNDTGEADGKAPNRHADEVGPDGGKINDDTGEAVGKRPVQATNISGGNNNPDAYGDKIGGNNQPSDRGRVGNESGDYNNDSNNPSSNSSNSGPVTRRTPIIKHTNSNTDDPIDNPKLHTGKKDADGKPIRKQYPTEEERPKPPENGGKNTNGSTGGSTISNSGSV